MKVTVLIDNNALDGLAGEWGLSFFIEHNGREYLLDTGESCKFLDNARSLGIDLSQVDCAVLSHAHYDHSTGTEVFFGANSRAKLYVSPAARENCYSGKGLIKRYIGLPKGLFSSFPDRICTPQGICRIGEGVYLVPHSAPGLKAVARRSYLYVRRWWGFVPDDFSHEQSLVLRIPDGLAVFNSCSHSGADFIADEIHAAFPGERICVYFGGLHLFRLSDAQVRDFAERIKAAGIGSIYTGHCTGDRAFEILQEKMGSTSVHRFYSGFSVTL